MTPDHLVEVLDSAGDLPAGFGPVLRAVAREKFIPDRMWVNVNRECRAVDRVTQPDAWLSYVYSDLAIVTQYNDGATKWPDVGTVPSSSASMPSVVAGMLSYLDVAPGQQVLEIGTGTGFNAALLDHLTGSDGRVTTVEVDKDLFETARGNLADTHVRTVLGDGAHGDPDGASFDRVIATAGVHLGRVPYAWISQTRPGGMILAPVRADLASGPLVLWAVDEDGRATGKAMPMGVGFMELRAQRTPSAIDEDMVLRLVGDAEESRTDLDATAVLTNPHSRWALAIALPSCRYGIDDGDSGDVVWLRDPMSRSWARIESGTVHQFGPRRLWDAADAAYRWWRTAGSPSVLDWTWTITPTRQSVTLDS